VKASIVELDVGAGDEVPDGRRNEDLPAPGLGHYSRADMDRDPTNVVTREFDLAAVDTDADLEIERPDRFGHRLRCPDRRARPVEEDEEPITGGVDLATAKPRDDRSISGVPRGTSGSA
jgi:hypothetical protein